MNIPELNYELVSKSLIYFLKKEIERIGFTDAVLGLSGGLDSALVCFLAKEALGSKNVTGLLLPYKSSSKSSIDDAMKVVEATGINYHKLEISEAVDAIKKHNMVNPEKSTAGRMGNIMARIRMVTIFDYSFATNSIVLGTSNKSELALGYATLFGDVASAINPIGDLYKTQIFKLAEYLGIPDTIINKPPSADLWEGQTDENEIGYTYEQIDPVLYQFLEKRKTKKQLYDLGFKKELVDFIDRKIITMHYKRKIPVIAKLTSRTFGVDFLYAKDIGT